MTEPSAARVSKPQGSGEGRFPRRDVLRWIYLTRIGLAGGLFVGAVFAWTAASPVRTLTATLVLVFALVLTPASYWYTHIRQRRVDMSFVYTQAIFDALLVTLTVDLTGGSNSVVAPLYILLISAYTLMLPLSGGFLVTAMACIAYIADVVWGQGTAVNTVVGLQLGIFVLVALMVGAITTKLTQTGAELTSVEDALQQLRLDTDDVLGNIPTAVLTIDGEGRLAYANPAAETLLGISADAWRERPVLFELHQRSTELQQILERTQRYRMPVSSAEITVSRNSGDIPVGISTAVLERKEGPPSVTAIMRDISDVKRIQKLRQRTERLEAVAELSASLAHEIKNPLASISSSVQQLELSSGADDDDRLLSRLIQRESDRLSRLLSDFIDFARIHIERSRELDLRSVVTQAVELIRQHPAYGEDTTIEVRLDEEPVIFDGDEDLMHRVVTNLVLNALQVAEPGKKTTVAVEAYNSAGRPALLGVDITDPVTLTVADDGPGIPDSDLKRVFDPFFSRRAGGTGLGLAIVHRAVREHDGTILVTSTTEAGTQFTVCLPRKSPAT